MAAAGQAVEEPPPPQEQEQEQEQATSTRVFYLGPVRLEVDCVEAFRGQLLGSGVDATGVMLWPGSFTLSSFLLQTLLLPPTSPPSGSNRLSTAHIVELGAGATGLAGLLASRLLPPTSRVTLTDRDGTALALLRTNAARVTAASDSKDRVAARLLSWGDAGHADQIVAGRGVASLCLGADVLYPAIDVGTVASLLRSARRLLGHGPDGRFLLSFIDRDNKASLRNLLRALRQQQSFLLEKAWELEGQPAHHRLEEEEEEGEDEERGLQTGRRRAVVLMRGAKLLLLAPLAAAAAEEDALALEERQAAAEARWLPGVWEEPQGPGNGGHGGESETDEEWAPPLMLSDEEEE